MQPRHSRWPQACVLPPAHSGAIRSAATGQDRGMFDGVMIGMRGEASLVVGTNDTASRIGSGRVPVLGTPVMITLIEEAALACIEDALPEGHQSLGTHLDEIGRASCR